MPRRKTKDMSGAGFLDAAKDFVKKHRLVSKALHEVKKVVPAKFQGIAKSVQDVVRQEGYGRKRRSRK